MDATTGEIAPAGAAGTRPGSAWARAPSTASNTRSTRAVADADRRGELRVEDRARRRRHPHRPEDAGRLGNARVLGDEVGVDRLAEERVRDAVAGDVQRRAHLGVRAREVEVERVAATVSATWRRIGTSERRSSSMYSVKR